jgi:hypothetical protein
MRENESATLLAGRVIGARLSLGDWYPVARWDFCGSFCPSDGASFSYTPPVWTVAP